MAKFYHTMLGGNSATPNIRAYKVDNLGDTLESVISFNDNITSRINALSFAPDNNYLAVAFVDSPYLAIYKRFGDEYRRLTNPVDVLPAGAGQAVTWSYEGTFLAIGHSNAPFLTIYQRNGDTFTKIPDPDTLPSAQCAALQFCPTGPYLAYGTTLGTSGTRQGVYRYDNTTFTPLIVPGANTLNTYTSLWSKDGMRVLFCVTTSPRVFRRSGDSFTEEPFVTATTGEIRAAAWHPDGTHFYVGTISSPYLNIYKTDGTQWVRQAMPPSTGSNSFAVTVTPDARHVIVGTQNSPFLLDYLINGDGLTLQPAPSTLPAASRFAAATSGFMDSGLAYIYTEGLRGLLAGEFDLASLKVALLTNDATFDATNTSLSQVTNGGAYEVHGNNWPQGGVVIPNVHYQTVPNGAALTMGGVSQNIIGGDVTSSKAVIYDQSTSVPIAFIDYEGAVTAVNGERMLFTFAENGLILFQRKGT